MNAQEINQTFDLFPLAAADAELRRSGRWYIGPCPFCGGDDRFNLTQTAEGWRWFCRKCGDGKYHGAVDYMMRRDNLTFIEVLHRLGAAYTPGPRPKPAQRPPEIPLPDDAWQHAASQQALAASDRLLTHPGVQAARDFLSKRALPPATWRQWLLGFDMVFRPLTKSKCPAITIPYVDNDLVTAIKYRFIDDLAAQNKKLRYGQRKGGECYLFGLWDYDPAGSQTGLVVVEGELNALSVWQCRPPGYLAVSLGSDSIRAQTKLLLAALLPRFSQVCFWMDNPQKAQDLASELHPDARCLRSPEINGAKYDANQMLQARLLHGFLGAVLPKVKEVHSDHCNQ